EIISPAAVPTGPSAPRKGVVLLLSGFLGGAFGLAAALLFASFDQSARLPRHLAEVGLACLAVVPASRQMRRRATAKRNRKPGSLMPDMNPDTKVGTALRRAGIAVDAALPEGGR